MFGQKNELGGELGAGSIPGYLTFDASTSISTGNAFADLLLGRISSYGQQDQRVKYYNRYKIVEPYFQDDWHVTSHLTLNLGLRVSLFGTYREKQKQAFNFDPAHYQAGVTTINPDGSVNNLFINGLPNGIVQCGVTPGVPVSCMEGKLFNPAPRIGFAYDPNGDGQDRDPRRLRHLLRTRQWQRGQHRIARELASPGQCRGGEQHRRVCRYRKPSERSSRLSVNAIPTKAIWPYIQQWHLDVQHEVVQEHGGHGFVCRQQGYQAEPANQLQPDSCAAALRSTLMRRASLSTPTQPLRPSTRTAIT